MEMNHECVHCAPTNVYVHCVVFNCVHFTQTRTHLTYDWSLCVNLTP